MDMYETRIQMVSHYGKPNANGVIYTKEAIEEGIKNSIISECLESGLLPLYYDPFFDPTKRGDEFKSGFLSLTKLENKIATIKGIDIEAGEVTVYTPYAENIEKINKLIADEYKVFMIYTADSEETRNNMITTSMKIVCFYLDKLNKNVGKNHKYSIRCITDIDQNSNISNMKLISTQLVK